MKPRSLLLALLLLLALPGGAPLAQNAAQQKTQLQRRIDELNARIAADEKEIAAIQRNRKATQTRIHRLSGTIDNRRRLVREIDSQIALLKSDIRSLEEEARSLQRELEHQRASYAAMVREAYRNYRNNDILTYLFSARNFSDATRKIASIRYASRYREQKVERIDSLSALLDERLGRLNEEKAALDASHRSYRGELGKLSRDEQRFKKSLSELSAKERRVLQSKLDRQKELERIVAELRRQGMKTDVGGSIKDHLGRLPVPVIGGRLKNNPAEKIAEIVGSKGSKAVSVFEGEVMQVSYNATASMYFVIIAHGEYATSYSNLSSVSVKKGDKVRQSQPIGTIAQSVDFATGQREYKLVFGIFLPRETLNAYRCIGG